MTMPMTEISWTSVEPRRNVRTPLVEARAKPLVVLIDFWNLYAYSSKTIPKNGSIRARFLHILKMRLDDLGVSLDPKTRDQTHHCILVRDHVRQRHNWRRQLCPRFQKETPLRIGSRERHHHTDWDPCSHAELIPTKTREMDTFFQMLAVTHLFARDVEADDIIAVMVAQFYKKCQMVILSNDRDYVSLIQSCPHLRVFTFEGQPRTFLNTAIYDLTCYMLGDCSKGIPSALTGESERWPMGHPLLQKVNAWARSISHGEFDGLPEMFVVVRPDDTVCCRPRHQVLFSLSQNQILMDLRYIPEYVEWFTMAQIYPFLPGSLQRLLPSDERAFYEHLHQSNDGHLRPIGKFPLTLSPTPSSPLFRTG